MNDRIKEFPTEAEAEEFAEAEERCSPWDFVRVVEAYNLIIDA
jgi:hypothetical protein